MASSRKRQNGDGTIYPYKGDRYRASLLMPDGTRRTRVHQTYAKAEAWLVEARTRRNHGNSGWSATKMPTLQEWWDTWLSLKATTAKRRTVGSYASVRSRYIPSMLLKKPLNEITAFDIERLYADLAKRPTYGVKNNKPLSRSTVHQVHRVVRACLNAAYSKGVIAFNPMSRVSSPPTAKGKNDWLRQSEVRAVLKAAQGDDLEALWLVSVILGPRQAESLALTWADVDWANKTLQIERQVHRVKGEWLFEDTKADEVRVLPLDDRLVEALKRRRGIQSAQRLKAGSRWQDFDLIFTTSLGTPIEERNDRKAWYALLDQAGVRRVRRQDARHTAGSLHYSSTQDAKQVQTLLGHADPRFTVAVYVHADAESLRPTQEAVLDALYG